MEDSIEPSSKENRALVVAGVACLLGILFLQLTLSVNRNSITWDEDDHIYAGYMSWKHADFGLNPEHPPLVKSLAAIPLLNMNLKVPALQDRFFKHEAFQGGKEFLFKNDADAILFRARMAASLLTLLLMLMVFFAAREMFSTGAAFIALGLLVFDPTVLAHGAVVGTDMGLSCFLFASVYAFYRYVKKPSSVRLVLVGLAAGLALAAKHTGILVFPVLLLLAIAEIVRSQGASSRKQGSIRFVMALAVASVIAVTVLWAFYGFRYSARPAGLAVNPPLAEFLQRLSRPREARLLATVAHWRLLPESYIYGLADVRIMSDFYASFLLGKVYPHGVWFYFPVTFLIKSSLSFLLLLIVAVWTIVARIFNATREILFLTIPPAFHLLIAMSSGMNIGVRHILPMYIFLAVLIGGASWKLIAVNRQWIYAVAILLIFQAVSVGRTFPAYMAYANEGWGGPSQTYKLLSDSNVDWGQQLKAVKRYLDRRGIKDCWFIYFAEGVVDTGYYGIPCKPLPTADSLWGEEVLSAPPVVDGTILVSAGDLSGFEFGAGPLNPYEVFKLVKPVDVIDYGVFVFQGRFDIPLAAAISHAQKAGLLLKAQSLPESLAEAQQAVAFAPDAVKPNAVLGDVLTAMNRPGEAKQSYERALTLAKTIEPEFQVEWVETLERKLKAQ